MQRVHLHPSISSNGCIAPVLMKNCPICGSISVWKWAFWVQEKSFLSSKRCYNFEFLGCGMTSLPLKNFMHPSCQVLGAAPATCKETRPRLTFKLIRISNKVWLSDLIFKAIGQKLLPKWPDPLWCSLPILSTFLHYIIMKIYQCVLSCIITT